MLSFASLNSSYSVNQLDIINAIILSAVQAYHERAAVWSTASRLKPDFLEWRFKAPSL